jgi:O-antigen ligase
MGAHRYRFDRAAHSHASGPQIESIDPYLSSSQAEFAANNWSLAWTAFSENPLWGTGIGNFGQSYHILSDIEGTEVHSQYGAVLAETGILGAVPFLVFLIIVLRRTAKLLSAKPVLIWIVVALAISLLGNLVAGIYVIFFRRREVWLVFGLLLAYADLLRQQTAAAGESGTPGSGPQSRVQGQRS